MGACTSNEVPRNKQKAPTKKATPSTPSSRSPSSPSSPTSPKSQDDDEDDPVTAAKKRTSLKNENKLESALRAKRQNVFSKGVSSGFTLKNIPKTPEQTKFLVESLKKIYIFNSLHQTDLISVVGAMELRNFEQDQNIIVQGQEGDYFYIVDEGSVNIIVGGTLINSMGKGSSFGELALLYNSPRTATVQAAQDTTVFSLDRDSFIYTIARETEARLQEIRTALAKVHILTDLTAEQIEKLSEAVELVQLSAGTEIIKKGNVGNVFYIIKEGKVLVTELGGTFSDHQLQEGEYFGEKALLTGEPRGATVTASTDVVLLALDRTTFSEFLGPIRELIDENNNIRILKTIKTFEKLSNEWCSYLAKSLVLKTYAAGVSIIREGDAGNVFFILKFGEADVVKGTTQLKSITAGDYFGEMALINEEVRSATIVATTDCEVFELDRETFKQILSIFDEEEERRRKEELEAVEVAQYEFKDLKTLGLLGTGTFGRVTLVRDSKSGAVFALKAMVKAQVKAMGQVKNIQAEKNMMMLASGSPFILRLYQTFQDPLRLYMLLEFVQGGELYSILHTSKTNGVSNDDAKFYAAGVLEGLAYLHKKQIAYRDMKPENCLIDKFGYPKIVDFGFAKIITSKSFTLCGTPEYLAPEIVLGRGHNKAVDYWSFGVLIYEMQNGTSPFADTSGNFDQARIFQNITNNNLRFKATFNTHCKSLVTGLLTTNPNQRFGNRRAGVTEIRKHAWFSDLNWEQYRKKTIKAPWIPPIKGEVDTRNFNTQGLEGDHLEVDMSVKVDDIDWSF